MNRLVPLLLIPMFMLGHTALYAFSGPHSHAGTSVVEPNGHSLRPHIHLSADHHHEHDDDDHEHHHAGDQSDVEHSETAATATLSVPTDHDSDAVYLSDSDWTASRTVATSEVDSASVDWTSLGPSFDRDSRPGGRCGDPPDRYAGLPIYLLTASLRL